MSEPVRWWVGRCISCGAVRAIDVHDPTSFAANPRLVVGLEDAPVACGDHTCVSPPMLPRPKLHGPRRAPPR